MRYADRTTVLAQLKLDPNNAVDAAAIERVERLENGIAAALDHKTGREFDLAPVAEARVVTGSGDSPRLVLHAGVRSVDAIEIGGEWDGLAWTGGDALDPADYLLALVDHDGIAWAIDRLDAVGWPQRVRVTAVWGDQSIEGVPDDIREAATFLTIDEYRLRTASPVGEVGPNGLTVRLRDPWKDTIVATAIARHTVPKVLV